MREVIRDWRHSLRGRQVRSVKKRAPLESSLAANQQPLPEPPGPSHGSDRNRAQGASGRAEDQEQGSVKRLLDRLGNLSVGPSTSQQTVVHNRPTEDQPMPDAPGLDQPTLIPDLPPVPVPQHVKLVYPILPPPPIPGPSDNPLPPPVPPPVAQGQEVAPVEDWGNAIKRQDDPGVEAAARVIEVAQNGFNQSNSSIQWSVDLPTRVPVVKEDESDWVHHKVPGWGTDEKKDDNNDGKETDDDDDDDDDEDDEDDEDDDDDDDTDWGQGQTERWMEDFGPNKFADRDYVDSKEPDDPEVCEKNSDEDIMTFGIELEFLLAVSSAMRKRPGEEYRIDPHPRERRWISRKLESRAINRNDDDDLDTLYFKRYATRRIVRLLLRNGVPAHEDNMGMYMEDLSESDFTDDETPNWKSVLRRFTVNEKYDPNRTHYQNGRIGFRFVDEFCRFCESNDVDILKMKTDDVDSARERVEECLYDWPNNVHRNQVTANFEFKLSQSCEDRRALDRLALATAEDSLHVPIKGLNSNYTAWSVVEDLSLHGDGMVPSRYLIPMFNPSKRPMRDYYWFGAEVVSPPLSIHDKKAHEAIRKACSALRGSLRCHKPMEASSGLHVHLGHKHGWNLLQIKRFVTLWALMEPVLIHLHRKDRGSPTTRWCRNLDEGTCLGQALFHPDPQVRYRQSGCLPRSSPTERARNRAAMDDHFDISTTDRRMREFVQNVWHYTSITDLTNALAGGEDDEMDYIRPAIRVRIKGDKKSDDPDENNPATIEVRTMHGTLDADHILEWLVVLEKILALSRYATNEVYKGTVLLATRMLNRTDSQVHSLLLGLQLPPRTIHYFMSDLNRVGNAAHGEDWWVYPDLDVVDWLDPFMAPGHRATHGEKYDFVNS